MTSSSKQRLFYLLLLGRPGENNRCRDETGEKGEGLWDTGPGGMEKGEHAFRVQPLRRILGQAAFGRGSPFGMEPDSISFQASVPPNLEPFSPVSSPPPQPGQRCPKPESLVKLAKTRKASGLQKSCANSFCYQDVFVIMGET
jgi:hypothetical protein